MSIDNMSKRSLAVDGPKLARLRRVRGLNSLEASSRIGISLNTLKKAERGGRILFSTVQLLAQYYNVSFDELDSVHSKLKQNTKSTGELDNRHFELGQIKCTLNQVAQHSCGAIVHITGISGIGKTYFLRQSLTLAWVNDFTIIFQTLEVNTDWFALCSKIMDSLKEDARSNGSEDSSCTVPATDLLTLTMEELLVKQMSNFHRSVIICLDDLHLANDALLYRLIHFLQNFVSLPVAFIFSSSQENSIITEMMYRAQLKMPLSTLRLLPLKADHLQVLTAKYPKQDRLLWQQMIEESHGVPLLLLDQLNFLSKASYEPSEMQRSLKYKMNLLSVSERSVMELLALCESPLKRQDIALLNDSNSFDIDKMIELFFLQEDEYGRVSFFHPAIARVFLESLNSLEKQSFHQQLADFYLGRQQLLYNKHMKESRRLARGALATSDVQKVETLLESKKYDVALREIGILLRSQDSLQQQSRLYRLKAQVLDSMSSLDEDQMC
ncbi:MAG: helix-turn-helix domain-containing protein [Lentisphaeraceae bacterium]|nr:helix-turn-helix domain-containing protein [Lentisphaeraceae bacterium]